MGQIVLNGRSRRRLQDGGTFLGAQPTHLHRIREMLTCEVSSLNAYHPLVRAWLVQVLTNGGPPVSHKTLYALDKFCRGLDTYGLTSLIAAANCFVPDSIQASCAPIICSHGYKYWQPWSYAPSVANYGQGLPRSALGINGLTGGDDNPPNQYGRILDTGVFCSDLWPLDVTNTYTTAFGMTFYDSNYAPNASFDERYFGSYDSTPPFGNDYVFFNPTSGPRYFYINSVYFYEYSPSVFTGYFSINATGDASSSTLNVYHATSTSPHGVLFNSTNSALGASTANCSVYVLGVNGSGSPTGTPATWVPQGFTTDTLSFFAIHQPLTATQSSNLYSLVQQVRQDLGGGWL